MDNTIYKGNTQFVFNKMNKDLDLIKSSELIRKQYRSLEKFLKNKNIEIIKFFTQIKRNQDYKGLVSETMFFDNRFVYDIILGVDNIDTHIVLIEYISKINVSTVPSYSVEKQEDGSNIQKVEFSSNLQISYQDETQLYYNSSTDRYEELLEISDILTKLITK